MKQYQYREPEEVFEEMTICLESELNRILTDQEIKSIEWISNCGYETYGTILDLFKEIITKKGN